MHNYLLYYIIILPLSVMPMFVLHGISRFLYFWLYLVFGYRKEVVTTNLKKSFPEKTEAEIKKIRKHFYLHLCDLVVESIKVFTISEKQIRKRIHGVNPEIVNKYFAEGRNVVLAGGHYNSWEMYALCAPLELNGDIHAIFKPLANKFWNGKMKASRSKTGTTMIPPKEVSTLFESQGDTPTGLIFATDQSPSNPNKAYWMDFLNQDTAVFFGTEKIAKENNCVVIYGTIEKVKRSHYRVIYEELTDDPQSLPYGAITEMHTKRLEEHIKLEPRYWLWSHKRWKKKRPVNDE